MQKSRKSIRAKGDPEGQKRRHASRYVAFGLVILGAFSVVVCGYGHAALSTNLQINGEADIRPSAKTFGINYMQEMTSAICARAEEGTAERLADQRDGKMYWVAKLKDGHCWMTQNLALDLTTAGLTSELTDLQPNTIANYETSTNDKGETVYHWNANSKYPPLNTTVGPFSASDTSANYVSAKSSKPDREYVMGVPYRLSAVKDEKKSNMGAFTGIDIRDVTGWEPTFDYTSQEVGAYSYDAAAKTYDAHYLMGNFYQFGAATAGSARQATNTTTRAKAASSICPKGWRLPDQTTLANNEFQDLLKAYGMTKLFNNTEQSPLKPPLYLFFGGYVTSGSVFYRVGQYGTYATNRGGDIKGDWFVFMIDGRGTNGTITGSNAGAAAWVGRSVRCVAR